MGKRPLCMVCLLLLIAQTILFLGRGGNASAAIPASSIFYEQESEEIVIQGQVYQKQTTSDYQILYLMNNSVHDSKLMVYDDTFTKIAIGQYLTLAGHAQAYSKNTNPGNFDQALYYARQGIYGSIWCEKIYSVEGKINDFKETLYQIKCRWKEELILHMGQEHGSIMAAMILSEKSQMDETVKELYQKNGIGHILAISGLHISFIGYGIYTLCKKTGMGYLCSGIFSALLLGLYILMIGWSVSVFRAFVMFLLKIGADITGRVYDMGTALAIAAVTTVSYEPLYLTDGGFYMSYLAILGLLIVFPLFQKSFSIRKNILSGGASSFAISIILFPVLLYFYYEIPVYSMLLNMLVIPMMSFVLGFGLAGSLLVVIFAPIGQVCFFVCRLILYFYRWICEITLQIPGARCVLGKPQIWMLVFYYLVLAFVLMIVRRCRKPRRYIWLLLVIPIFFFLPRKPRQLEVVMVDVGQGDGIFLQSLKGTTYLIDGGSSDVKQVGKYRLEPFLLSKGIRRLDYVFVTHGDADHYNGIEEMLLRQEVGVEIGYMVLPSYYQEDEELLALALRGKEYGCKILTMNAGDVIREEMLSITALQPGYTDKLYGNEGSLVLDVSYGSFAMLCTGDVEGEGEEQLIKNVRNKKYQVLKVAHHGARYSTSEEFLTHVHPNIALISCGKENTYGHPHEETLERLEEIGCEIYQTDIMGAITIRTDGNSLTITLLPYRL